MTTDSAFPFGDGPAPVDPEDSSSADRRKLLMVVAGAAVLVLLAAVYFLFLKGGGSSVESGLVPSAHHATLVHHAAKPTTTHKTSTAKPGTTVPKTFKDVVGRDPFVPLYVAPVAATSPTGTGTVATVGGSTTGAPATDLGSSSSATTSSLGTRVSLLRVYSKNGVLFATTKVNSVVYNPKVGATFASSFQLVKVSGKSATYLDGDVQFTLQEGQEVLK
jgi:hypothetical protein